jgi:hypothetical protein
LNCMVVEVIDGSDFRGLVVSGEELAVKREQ